MFKAVLFDLDGTLLDIDMQQFLPHYFRQMVLMAGNEGLSDPRRLVEQVFNSTRVMIADKDPQTTNQQVFMRDFFAATGWEEDPIKEFFDKFYSQAFPGLRKYSQPFAGIPQMMERLRRDTRVVIATNAVFPRSALKERLYWAGLGKFDFELITSYEIMHFCKPHPEYYAEILDMINMKAGECLMVGNDIGEDLPAGTIGIKTFLLENMLIDNGADYKPDWRGDLNEFYRFISALK